MPVFLTAPRRRRQSRRGIFIVDSKLRPPPPCCQATAAPVQRASRRSLWNALDGPTGLVDPFDWIIRVPGCRRKIGRVVHKSVIGLTSTNWYETGPAAPAGQRLQRDVGFGIHIATQGVA